MLLTANDREILVEMLAENATYSTHFDEYVDHFCEMTEADRYTLELLLNENLLDTMFFENYFYATQQEYFDELDDEELVAIAEDQGLDWRYDDDEEDEDVEVEEAPVEEPKTEESTEPKTEEPTNG